MVVGIGGTFIYSNDPPALAAWYARVLGLGTGDPGAPFIGHDFPVREADGAQRQTHCVWAIFASDESHPVSPASFTINYRVDDIDAILARAQSHGVAADRRDDNEYGRFAWLKDPDGREVELWQDLTMT